jgi:hypothetical protein
MIDCQARDKLVEEMRHFVVGFTDNFEFDDAALNIERKIVESKRFVTRCGLPTTISEDTSWKEVGR